MVERADMILRAAQGQRTDEIATALRTRPARVSKWRTRFARQRLRGLTDVPRAGAPRRYDGTGLGATLDFHHGRRVSPSRNGHVIGFAARPGARRRDKTYRQHVEEWQRSGWGCYGLED